MKDSDNILYVTKDEIFNRVIESPETQSDDKNSYVDIFTYENLCQEYDFVTGDTTLYLEVGEDKYKTIYSLSHEKNGESIIVSQDNDVYIVNGYNPNKQEIDTLDYFSEKDFIGLINIVTETHKNFITKFINDYHTLIHIGKKSTRLIQNGECLDYENNGNILSKFKSLFIKYMAATSFIPAYNILDNSISNIHSYIAKGDNNISDIITRLDEIKRFKNFCPSSYSLLSSFVNNPKSTDLRCLCDLLSKNMSNIENLLSLYLEDELIKQDKEK